MKKAVFYHAGCPVCLAAEQQVLDALDKGRYELEVVHLGADRRRIVEAEQAGIQSVPALLLDEGVFHINFGASLADVKGGA
ncbi:MAG: thioredoxin family protein [gamma proteobacterium symbiont of Stewartia floridana]|nr:conjugal transfer protein TraF [Shewanella sp.]MCG7869064.1 conjugal transfer protein TraF [Candidatus Thiodiazotropha taylori]MCG8096410.1 conjugal transfer protein TraF [Candidatus Thiodiazotropha endolucinida]RLW51612.1 MAG: thioredoxin family protein [gamma proteobacterium symbiont of Stewartia floridana]MCG7910022.1 conjugal transfer protein TraF [Candidatus Thiodiazotropha taylori]